MTDSFWIQSEQVVTPEGLQPLAVFISEGRIQRLALEPDNDCPVEKADPRHYLIPGMIDMHIHGAKDADVMDGSPAALKTIREALAAEGATAFLATTMTESSERIEAALTAVQHEMQTQEAQEGAEILGVHLEGPFISSDKMGAQNGGFIQAPSAVVLDQWIQKTGVRVALVTLAPENPGASELIQYCVDNHIVASIGHSKASFDCAKAAFDTGISHCTHLYNAMTGFNHREPGVAAAVLSDERVLAELIVDGVHVHPAICELTLKVKGLAHLALVTDAMRAKCMPDGEYSLGGQAVFVKDGAARLSDGVLAGSVLTMNRALANLLKFTGCSIEEAVQLTATNPAKQLDVYDRKGSIEVGKEADLVLLDAEYAVVETWCRGCKIRRTS